MSWAAGNLISGSTWDVGPLIFSSSTVDTLAPVFTAGLTSSSITTSGLTVGFTLNENSTVYIIVVAQGSAVPTPAQIKAGVDYGAATVLYAQNKSVTGNQADSFNISGLSSGVQVTVYAVAEDGVPNLQDAAAVRSVTVQLLAVNNPPTSSGDYAQQSATVGQLFSFNGAANFSDTDALTYSLSGLTGATINENTGAISWTPSAGGDFIGTITATDTAGQSVSASLPIRVIAAITAVAIPIKRIVEWDEDQTPLLVVGDTFWHLATLMQGVNSSAFNVSAASSIKVALISLDHTKAYTDAVEIYSNLSGANWGAGVVSLFIDAVVTAQASAHIKNESLAKIEIEVTIAGNTFTWFAPVRVVPGYVH